MRFEVEIRRGGNVTREIRNTADSGYEPKPVPSREPPRVVGQQILLVSQTVPEKTDLASILEASIRSLAKAEPRRRVYDTRCAQHCNRGISGKRNK